MVNLRYKDNKSYTPSDALIKFLNETLQIEEEKEALQFAGENIDDDLDSRINKNKRMKVYVLDKLIFPSMSNLVIFFEYVSKHRELQKVFDGDIEELLLGRKDDGPSIFRRFLEGILIWTPKKFLRKDQKLSHDLNFRAELFNTMLMVAFLRVPSILKSQIPIQVVNSIANQDFARALAWTEILRSKTPIFDNSAVSRKVQF